MSESNSFVSVPEIHPPNTKIRKRAYEIPWRRFSSGGSNDLLASFPFLKSNRLSNNRLKAQINYKLLLIVLFSNLCNYFIFNVVIVALHWYNPIFFFLFFLFC